MRPRSSRRCERSSPYGSWLNTTRLQTILSTSCCFRTLSSPNLLEFPKQVGKAKRSKLHCSDQDDSALLQESSSKPGNRFLADKIRNMHRVV